MFVHKYIFMIILVRCHAQQFVVVPICSCTFFLCEDKMLIFWKFKIWLFYLWMMGNFEYRIYRLTTNSGLLFVEMPSKILTGTCMVFCSSRWLKVVHRFLQSQKMKFLKHMLKMSVHHLELHQSFMLMG